MSIRAPVQDSKASEGRRDCHPHAAKAACFSSPLLTYLFKQILDLEDVEVENAQPHSGKRKLFAALSLRFWPSREALKSHGPLLSGLGASGLEVFWGGFPRLVIFGAPRANERCKRQMQTTDADDRCNVSRNKVLARNEKL